MKTAFPSTISRKAQPARQVQQSGLTTTRVGFWSALIFTLAMTALNIAYVPMVRATTGRVWQGVENYGSNVKLIEYLPQSFGLVALPAFLVMLVCLHSLTGEDRKPWSLLGVSFGALFVALVSCVYFVAITAVKRSVELGEWDGLSPWVMGNPNSIIYALDYLGWGLFLGLSNVFTGLGMDSNRLGRWTSGLLLLNGVASLLLFVGFVFNIMWIQYPALFTWMFVLPAVGVLFTLRFQRFSV